MKELIAVDLGGSCRGLQPRPGFAGAQKILWGGIPEELQALRRRYPSAQRLVRLERRLPDLDS